MKIRLLVLIFLLPIASAQAMIDLKAYLHEINPKVVEKNESFTVTLLKHDKGSKWTAVDSGNDATLKRSNILQDDSMSFIFKAHKKGFVQVTVYEPNQDSGNQYRHFAVSIADKDPENK